MLLLTFSLSLLPSAFACIKRTRIVKHHNLSGENNWFGSKTGKASIECPVNTIMVDFECNVKRNGFVVTDASPIEGQEAVSCTIRNENKGRASAAAEATVICAKPEDVEAGLARTTQCDTVVVFRKHTKVDKFQEPTTVAECDPGMVMLDYRCGFDKIINDQTGADAIFGDFAGLPRGVQCRGRKDVKLLEKYNLVINTNIRCAPEESLLDGSVRFTGRVREKTFSDVFLNNKALTVTLSCPQNSLNTTKRLAHECIISGENAGSFGGSFLKSGADHEYAINRFEEDDTTVRCSMAKVRGVLPQTATLKALVFCVEASFDPQSVLEQLEH